jgi:hypothetical protein
MSASMLIQAGRAHLKHSDMRLDLSMAKMVTQGYTHVSNEETQYRINNLPPKFEKRRNGELNFWDLNR